MPNINLDEVPMPEEGDDISILVQRAKQFYKEQIESGEPKVEQPVSLEEKLKNTTSREEKEAILKEAGLLSEKWLNNPTTKEILDLKENRSKTERILNQNQESVISTADIENRLKASRTFDEKGRFDERTFEEKQKILTEMGMNPLTRFDKEEKGKNFMENEFSPQAYEARKKISETYK